MSVYPEPTLLTCRHGSNNVDGCCTRCGMTWGEQAAERAHARDHSLHVSPDPDDGPWISERDQQGGWNFPNDGKGAPE